MHGGIPKLNFYYMNIRACAYKINLTFTLALKQICESSIFTSHKEHRCSHTVTDNTKTR
jgi:hypothetical protein